MATIKEVAKEAHVSIATVSRILNNDQSIVVLDETRQRVLEVAKKLDYKPLRQRSRKQYVKKTIRTWKIGILTWNNTEDDKEDPYFKEIIDGIEEQAYELDMRIVQTVRLRRRTGEEKLHELDGIIVIGKSVADDIASLYPGKNIVFVDQNPDKARFDSVTSDLAQASENVLNHLLSLGHRRIGFIGGREFTQRTDGSEKQAVDQRLAHYIRYMKDRQLYEEGLVYLGNDEIGDWNSYAGYQLMREALRQENLPEAFFIASDPMALGAIRALHEKGLKVPQHTAIVSVDDIEYASYVTPPLTTTKLHSTQMGRTAAHLLRNRIEGRDVPLQVIVPTEMVIRDSCGWRKKHTEGEDVS
ncbi:LacI family DNA-binding transcriptional regulator [Bacillus daqingensis]|uniref:LacI family DNA-binding transcriptional regulator n=1 Tax=Bacillus daqingensis TaxID=872396 RepID=A0ABV9NV01_9BACI